jgi:hypothetical protein
MEYVIKQDCTEETEKRIKRKHIPHKSDSKTPNDKKVTEKKYSQNEFFVSGYV